MRSNVAVLVLVFCAVVVLVLCAVLEHRARFATPARFARMARLARPLRSYTGGSGLLFSR